MKNLKFFVIIFLDELGLLLSILGFFKDFLEISLISLISANLPLPVMLCSKPSDYYYHYAQNYEWNYCPHIYDKKTPTHIYT